MRELWCDERVLVGDCVAQPPSAVGTVLGLILLWPLPTSCFLPAAFEGLF